MANITAPIGSGEFAGDEFSNNLFSDLATLLTLFGEQVAKQFLNMRYVKPDGMGWADNVLLAIGPLGIMTTIVSAIRVGRVTKLKAMVGKARESQSVAEQELLSSTSEDVCELWSGHEIVRVFGRPDGILRDTGSGPHRHTGVESSLLSRLRTSIAGNRSDSREDNYLGSLRNAAPNLALNVRNATAPAWELWTWAAVGVILQVIAVVVPGLATYHWEWTKGGIKVQGYGYPCFLIGTVLVVFGTMVCGHVIEGVTTEHTFAATDRAKEKGYVKILRLQRACTVSDQHFSSETIQQWSESKDPLYFAIASCPGADAPSKPAGVASYLSIVPEQRRIEIGCIILGDKLKRTRTATEAFYLMIKHAFEDLGYHRVKWKADNLNKPSLAAAVRLGIVHEGIFRKHMIIKGKWRDTAWYSITADEWPAVRKGFEIWLGEENFDDDGNQLCGLKECRDLQP